MLRRQQYSEGPVTFFFISWEIRTGGALSIAQRGCRNKSPLCWLMLKGSEIHHSQSLPAQKANHLRGARTMPHLPRRCVISRGSIQTAITPLYPLSVAQTRCQRWRWAARRGRSSCSQSQQMRKWFGGSRISNEDSQGRESLFSWRLSAWY